MKHGLKKAMNKEHIAVAMSGGVDSAVTAYLALRAGYQVTAVHLLMEPEMPDDEILQQCCEFLKIDLVKREKLLNLININICPHANKKERIKDLKELLKDNDNDILCLDNGTALKIDNNNIEIIYSIKTNQVKLLSNTKETIIDNSNIKKIINL